MTTPPTAPAQGPLNPLVPRPIDLPREVPLDPAADLTPLDEAKIFIAPEDPADWPAWRAALERWRDEARARLGSHNEHYEKPEGRWASQCRVIAQVWLWDELLYDFDARRFTPEKLVADARERFGGFDGIVLWHAYPVIGIDERNQWTYYRQVPGLAELVDALKALGLRVFCDYNPWDTGTERGASDAEELAATIRDYGFDGVFLDTLKQADQALLEPLFDANPGLALETESKLALTDIGTHTMSWAQWFADSPTPGVLKTHFYEPRHMQHHIRRWNRDHSEELQSAWLNGVGVMAWEVVFSAWVGWSQRDTATLRRMRAVHHAWGDLLTNGDYTPLVNLPRQVHEQGIYAARWCDDTRSLLALVNRTGQDVTIAKADFVGAIDGSALPLTWEAGEGEIRIPARSISGLVAGDGAQQVAAAAQQAPTSTSSAFPYLETVRVQPAEPCTSHAPQDAIHVPAGRHHLTVRYRCRETGLYGEAPFVEEWKPLHPRLHDLRTREFTVDTQEVWVAASEVTVGEFTQFVEETGHAWDSHGQNEPDEPVRWVDLHDARAYCAWAGGRLPSEHEWQLALQSVPDERNLAVWNWTDSEHTDSRSRFAILKGGSDCKVEGSEWYIEGGRKTPDYSLKYLCQGFDLDRNGWTGFRIAYERGVTE